MKDDDKDFEMEAAQLEAELEDLVRSGVSAGAIYGTTTKSYADNGGGGGGSYA